MSGNKTALLHSFWYLALPGRALKTGQFLPKRLMGQPLLLGRNADGTPFALRNICPHRGMPLHYGSFDGSELTCSYHGWKFGSDGHCTEIPSLLPDQDFGVSRVSVKSYPCRQVQGNIWVYFASRRLGTDEELPQIPLIPGVADTAPQIHLSMHFPCDTDHAAFGLMDPTHAAFVHTSWWWKKKARQLREKRKEFEPEPLGWCMKRHPLPPQNRVYRLFGEDVTTAISYRLPGLRIEHIQGNRHFAVGLTAITPLSETETEVHQCFYWSFRWLTLATPVLRYLARVFLGQDRDVVVQQQEGLVDSPPLMLIDDADTQAKWYSRLKQEWLKAQEEGRTFVNPIQAQTLRWRS